MFSKVNLISCVYQCDGADLPCIDIKCQVVVINGVSYAWIDGDDFDNPLLVPVESLVGFQRIGTLRDYLTDEAHIDLGEEFNTLLDIALRERCSATVIVRAVDAMHSEGQGAAEAIQLARDWAKLLNDLDNAERAAYQLVAHEAEERFSSRN